ncbi:hypothetical protein BDR07DRAFT_1489256 [Suillus spraguei]|nr:hypothetical protein BDR07DRAFT_1489256 [Suillus spraguei]
MTLFATTPPPTIGPPSAGTYGMPPPTTGLPSTGAYDTPLLTLGPPSAGAYGTPPPTLGPPSAGAYDMPLLTLGPPSAGAYGTPPPTLDFINDDDDDKMMLDVTGAGSPPQVAGIKHHFAVSPSPPPDAPQPFEIPTKPPASTYDSRLAFGAHKLSSHGARREEPSDMAHSMSTPSLTMHNTTPSLDYHVSPTPQTMLPNSGGNSKKGKVGHHGAGRPSLG